MESDYAEAFTLFDKDKDGTITFSEFKMAVRSMGQVLTDDEMDALGGGAKKFDLNAFIAAMNNASSSTLVGNLNEAELTAALQQFDKEKKGVLLSIELKGILTSLGDKFSEAECDRMFAMAGIKDGNVKYDDVLKRLIKGV
jgi:calmodulin